MCIRDRTGMQNKYKRKCVLCFLCEFFVRIILKNLSVVIDIFDFSLFSIKVIFIDFSNFSFAYLNYIKATKISKYNNKKRPHKMLSIDLKILA